MTATRVTAIFDTSALIRAVIEPVYFEARDWLAAVHRSHVRGWVPELVYVELANVLGRHVRLHGLPRDRAATILDYFTSLPLRPVPMRRLAAQSLETAIDCEISGYDAAYLVLARALDAVLVTADRRLAEHYDRVALLPGQGPP